MGDTNPFGRKSMNITCEATGRAMRRAHYLEKGLTMARYVKRLEIWKLDESARAALQPGQHVYCGDESARAVFLGMGSAGTTVAAHEGNMRGKSYAARLSYMRALRTYAKGR